MCVNIYLFLAHMARARLRDRHQENLRRKLQVLKAEQAVAVPAANSEAASSACSTPKASSVSDKVQTDTEDGPSTSNAGESAETAAK